jgi:hypothetical protein
MCYRLDFTFFFAVAKIQEKFDKRPFFKGNVSSEAKKTGSFKVFSQKRGKQA